MNEDLSINDALRLGIEAHTAGKVHEADKYYTAILKAQPYHPDANHNMGVLGVGVGKVEQALPFFKKALDANPKIEQFWISYIEALIKLVRPKDAKAVVTQAEETGITGEALDKLKEEITKLSTYKTPKTHEPPHQQLNSLINLYTRDQLQPALDQATQLLNEFQCL